ncbi:methyl-accepting chemotaxis protein [Lachnospiraceae bacterium KM106-2]|nr:methyl-accepting chemotaxis protein [Lachnospiraceae bacterium KM106-2]
MKRLHKINVIAIAIGGVALSASVLVQDVTTDYKLKVIGVMLATLALLIGIYFIQFNDELKGAINCLVFAYATLLLSAMQHGNSRTFIASFLAIGMVVIYFNRRITLIFSIGYLSVALLCGICFPYIIDGSNYETGSIATKIITYFALCFIIYNASGRAEQLMNQVKDQLKVSEESERKVREANELVMKGVNQLSKSIDESTNQLEELEEQSASVSEAATQMNQVIDATTNSIISVNESLTKYSKQTEDNYESAKALKTSFGEVINLVNSGNEDGNAVKQSMDDIENTIHTAKSSTDELLDEMSKISTILDEINAISKQTNLLSLNASIEAARAGEHGKGFAVVASEIGSLSSQSKEASDKVNAILSSLQSVVSVVADKVTHGAISVETGTNQLNALIESLNQIKETADTSQNHVDRQFKSIETMKEETIVMQEEIHNVVSMSEENTAMIESISQSVKEQAGAITVVSKQIRDIDEVAKSLETNINE